VSRRPTVVAQRRVALWDRVAVQRWGSAPAAVVNAVLVPNATQLQANVVWLLRPHVRPILLALVANNAVVGSPKINAATQMVRQYAAERKISRVQQTEIAAISIARVAHAPHSPG